MQPTTMLVSSYHCLLTKMVSSILLVGLVSSCLHLGVFHPLKSPPHMDWHCTTAAALARGASMESLTLAPISCPAIHFVIGHVLSVFYTAFQNKNQAALRKLSPAFPPVPPRDRRSVLSI